MHCLLGAFVTIFLAHCLFAAAPALAAKEGEMCSGIAAIACDKGLFCEKPAGKCNTPDLSGKCEVVPGACTADVAPVCACPDADGKAKEYSNDCNRKMAGAQKDYDGKCGSNK